MDWIRYFIIGVLLAAPLSALLAVYFSRRALATARRARRRQQKDRPLLDLGRLTGGLAHEIKNPLSTVKLNLKLLAEDFEGSQDELHRRNYSRLCRLQDEVQRLNDILDDFLKYAGGQELQPAEVDLRKVVEELVDFFRPQAETHRVVIRPSLPAEPVVCRVDVAMIKQAVLNLMINASQAMSEGGELLLRLARDGGSAVLEVIDTGPGIPPEARERIFDPYYSSRPGGSGLGLPTTRRIVRQHGGDMRVDSEKGRGTRFVVTLPVAEGAD